MACSRTLEEIDLKASANFHRLWSPSHFGVSNIRIGTGSCVEQPRSCSAEDVFESLAIPLMKLVGLKTEEMVSKLRVPASDKHQLLRLESEKSIFFHTTVHQKSQTEETTHIVTLKLFRTTFEHVGSALCSVEGGVEDLMYELAENMYPPMVEYVNGLKTELAAGTMIRLTSAVEKMERVVKNSRLELEEARKKVRVEEKRKSEALIKLKEVEEKGKAMRDFVGASVRGQEKVKGAFGFA
ncbi:hypothetical protein GIB67_026423 [Kingdonia uniflora]|uniref:Uncharacterized protein n=1 Tax=Kingdonia uniflora TaxID=39325 RepID=A0A7J7P670_9MAGN|nr:hypothetical protein GIB67_026423 [Kingdonia uniflora]